MLIKGTKGGNPILLSNEDLAKETISREFSLRSQKNKTRFVLKIEVEDISESGGRTTTSRQLNSPKSYSARAKVHYSIYNHSNNKVEESNKCVRIITRFTDTTDDLGQPDTSIIEFQEIDI